MSNSKPFKLSSGSRKFTTRSSGRDTEQLFDNYLASNIRPGSGNNYSSLFNSFRAPVGPAAGPPLVTGTARSASSANFSITRGAETDSDLPSELNITFSKKFVRDSLNLNNNNSNLIYRSSHSAGKSSKPAKRDSNKSSQTVTVTKPKKLMKFKPNFGTTNSSSTKNPGPLTGILKNASEGNLKPSGGPESTSTPINLIKKRAPPPGKYVNPFFSQVKLATRLGVGEFRYKGAKYVKTGVGRNNMVIFTPKKKRPN